jgi:uncharacterized Ntn-hydrolase superfamily protein
MKPRRPTLEERKATRTNRVVHAYARAGAIALRLFATPRYGHMQARVVRLHAALPESIRRAVSEQP